MNFGIVYDSHIYKYINIENLLALCIIRMKTFLLDLAFYLE